SRDGLDAERQAELDTGGVAGRRTDTVVLVHIPEGDGKPTMVSLPRDSYVPIPGHGKDKLNAAFAYGGPQLLARTVETATGVRIDHYAEIGLGGFADMTDAIGGVDICVEEPMQDPKANLDLQAGCQTLDGPQALGYVRTRARRPRSGRAAARVPRRADREGLQSRGLPQPGSPAPPGPQHFRRVPGRPGRPRLAPREPGLRH